MLLEISIEQFALIERVHLQFSGGLNVLTGETGAGKSIILDAVQAVLGGRTSPDVIRSGEEKAVVEAVFDLSARPDSAASLREMGIAIADDHLLLVRREINRSGRSAIRVNGRTVTAGMLRDATQGLVDLHGQHEHQSLLQVERHLDLLDQYGGSLLQQEGKPLELLDRYGGGPLLGLREILETIMQEMHAIGAQVQGLGGDERDRARKEDLLRFQVEELLEAKLQTGEEADLEADRQVLTHASKLKLTAANTYSTLYEGAHRQTSVYDLLGRVRSDLEDALRHDPSLADVVELVGSAAVQVQEASHLLAAYRDRVDDDPARLAAVEARLELLHALGRKYGDSVTDMLAYLEQATQELDRLEHSQELLARLHQKEAALGAKAAEVAQQLTTARRAAARELGTRVVRELAELGMASSRFEVAVDVPAGATYTHVTPRGWDHVEFLFSPNPGEPVKPLAKIVSGGEMSRIMLALKVILARVDGVPTLVFDEVDAGISGRTAQAVGEKLARIASDRQVLCVTHLPQVAALADQHFQIAKEVAAGRTVTHVIELDEDGRVDELSRMIGGAEVSPFTVDAARDILRRAEALKRDLRPA